MKRRVRANVSILLGVYLCATVVWGYLPIPQYIIELTCISNLLIGLFLIAAARKLLINEHDYPSIIYRMCLVTILFVLIISILGNFNFEGPFFFLHLVNPILFCIYYFVYIKESSTISRIFLTPIPIIFYLLFDFVLGKLRGQFIYGIFEVNDLSVTIALGIGLSVYFSLWLMGYIVYSTNIAIGKIMSHH